MTPVSSIIDETGRACSSLGNGIEIHPLGAYVMQTTFLRMTGASEQKLKCICWETASFDFDFRYKFLRNPLGECSSYDDKTGIYGKIREFLSSHGIDPELSDAEKDLIIDTCTNGFDKQLATSPLIWWFEKEYLDYKSTRKALTRNDFALPSKKKLLGTDLEEQFKATVYRQRNRYAHNLTSYQMNIPTFSQLAKQDNMTCNHFAMMSLLILLDGVFMALFDKIKTVIHHHSY